MISRRQLIAAAGAGALLAPAVLAQESVSTKRHIAQAAHLTIEVPAHWSHTPPLPGGVQSIGAEDGFFVANTLIAKADAAEFSAVFGLDEASVSEEQVIWRGMEATKLYHAANSALVIPNPHPILTFGGSADWLIFMGDTEHFHGILDTVRFGLDDVAASNLAISILDLIHTHSFFRDEVEWDELYDRAAEIEAESEIIDYLQFTVFSSLRAAGDNHSFIRNMDGIVNIATPTVGGQPPYYPSGEILGGYGYITFPATNMFTPEYQADYAHAAAVLRNEFAAAGVCGWIIDLRTMGGGSVSPLLTALYPFLPDGKLAGFLDAYGNEMWIEKDGQTIIPAAYLQDIGDVHWPGELSDPAIPIAVLTGPNNGSAGEFVQLALMSRENLLTFGLATGGYTTGNIGISLYTGHHIGLASSAELDIFGNVYTGKIEPDVEDFDIGRGKSILPGNLGTALDWLDGQCASSLT